MRVRQDRQRLMFLRVTHSMALTELPLKAGRLIDLDGANQLKHAPNLIYCNRQARHFITEQSRSIGRRVRSFKGYYRHTIHLYCMIPFVRKTINNARYPFHTQLNSGSFSILSPHTT